MSAARITDVRTTAPCFHLPKTLKPEVWCDIARRNELAPSVQEKEAL